MLRTGSKQLSKTRLPEADLPVTMSRLDAIPRKECTFNLSTLVEKEDRGCPISRAFFAREVGIFASTSQPRPLHGDPVHRRQQRITPPSSRCPSTAPAAPDFPRWPRSTLHSIAEPTPAVAALFHWSRSFSFPVRAQPVSPPDRTSPPSAPSSPAVAASGHVAPPLPCASSAS